MMGTAAVAIAAAATTQGTLVNKASGGGDLSEVRFGHPSGTLLVGGKTELVDGAWQSEKSVDESLSKAYYDWLKFLYQRMHFKRSHGLF